MEKMAEQFGNPISTSQFSMDTFTEDFDVGNLLSDSDNRGSETESCFSGFESDEEVFKLNSNNSDKTLVGRDIGEERMGTKSVINCDGSEGQHVDTGKFALQRSTLDIENTQDLSPKIKRTFRITYSTNDNSKSSCLSVNTGSTVRAFEAKNGEYEILQAVNNDDFNFDEFTSNGTEHERSPKLSNKDTNHNGNSHSKNSCSIVVIPFKTLEKINPWIWNKADTCNQILHSELEAYREVSTFGLPVNEQEEGRVAHPLNPFASQPRNVCIEIFPSKPLIIGPNQPGPEYLRCAPERIEEVVAIENMEIDEPEGPSNTGTFSSVLMDHPYSSQHDSYLEHNYSASHIPTSEDSGAKEIKKLKGNSGASTKGEFDVDDCEFDVSSTNKSNARMNRQKESDNSHTNLDLNKTPIMMGADKILNSSDIADRCLPNRYPYKVCIDYEKVMESSQKYSIYSFKSGNIVSDTLSHKRGNLISTSGNLDHETYEVIPQPKTTVNTFDNATDKILSSSDMDDRCSSNRYPCKICIDYEKILESRQKYSIYSFKSGNKVSDASSHQAGNIISASGNLVHETYEVISQPKTSVNTFDIATSDPQNIQFVTQQIHDKEIYQGLTMNVKSVNNTSNIVGTNSSIPDPQKNKRMTALKDLGHEICQTTFKTDFCRDAKINVSPTSRPSNLRIVKVISSPEELNGKSGQVMILKPKSIMNICNSANINCSTSDHQNSKVTTSENFNQGMYKELTSKPNIVGIWDDSVSSDSSSLVPKTEKILTTPETFKQVICSEATLKPDFKETLNDEVNNKSSTSKRLCSEVILMTEIPKQGLCKEVTPKSNIVGTFGDISKSDSKSPDPQSSKVISIPETLSQEVCGKVTCKHKSAVENCSSPIDICSICQHQYSKVILKARSKKLKEGVTIKKSRKKISTRSDAFSVTSDKQKLILPAVKLNQEVCREAIPKQRSRKSSNSVNAISGIAKESWSQGRSPEELEKDNCKHNTIVDISKLSLGEENIEKRMIKSVWHALSTQLINRVSEFNLALGKNKPIESNLKQVREKSTDTKGQNVLTFDHMLDNHNIKSEDDTQFANSKNNNVDSLTTNCSISCFNPVRERGTDNCNNVNVKESRLRYKQNGAARRIKDMLTTTRMSVNQDKFECFCKHNTVIPRKYRKDCCMESSSKRRLTKKVTRSDTENISYPFDRDLLFSSLGLVEKSSLDNEKSIPSLIAHRTRQVRATKTKEKEYRKRISQDLLSFSGTVSCKKALESQNCRVILHKIPHPFKLQDKGNSAKEFCRMISQAIPSSLTVQDKDISEKQQRNMITQEITSSTGKAEKDHSNISRDTPSSPTVKAKEISEKEHSNMISQEIPSSLTVKANEISKNERSNMITPDIPSHTMKAKEISKKEQSNMISQGIPSSLTVKAKEISKNEHSKMISQEIPSSTGKAEKAHSNISQDTPSSLTVKAKEISKKEHTNMISQETPPSLTVKANEISKNERSNMISPDIPSHTMKAKEISKKEQSNMISHTSLTVKAKEISKNEHSKMISQEIPSSTGKAEKDHSNISQDTPSSLTVKAKEISKKEHTNMISQDIPSSLTVKANEISKKEHNNVISQDIPSHTVKAREICEKEHSNMISQDIPSSLTVKANEISKKEHNNVISQDIPSHTLKAKEIFEKEHSNMISQDIPSLTVKANKISEKEHNMISQDIPSLTVKANKISKKEHSNVISPDIPSHTVKANNISKNEHSNMISQDIPSLTVKANNISKNEHSNMISQDIPSHTLKAKEISENEHSNMISQDIPSLTVKANKISEKECSNMISQEIPSSLTVKAKEISPSSLTVKAEEISEKEHSNLISSLTIQDKERSEHCKTVFKKVAPSSLVRVKDNSKESLLLSLNMNIKNEVNCTEDREDALLLDEDVVTEFSFEGFHDGNRKKRKKSTMVSVVKSDGECWKRPLNSYECNMNSHIDFNASEERLVQSFSPVGDNNNQNNNCRIDESQFIFQRRKVRVGKSRGFVSSKDSTKRSVYKGKSYSRLCKQYLADRKLSNTRQPVCKECQKSSQNTDNLKLHSATKCIHSQINSSSDCLQHAGVVIEQNASVCPADEPTLDSLARIKDSSNYTPRSDDRNNRCLSPGKTFDSRPQIVENISNTPENILSPSSVRHDSTDGSLTHSASVDSASSTGSHSSLCNDSSQSLMMPFDSTVEEADECDRVKTPASHDSVHSVTFPCDNDVAECVREKLPGKECGKASDQEERLPDSNEHTNKRVYVTQKVQQPLLEEPDFVGFDVAGSCDVNENVRQLCEHGYDKKDSVCVELEMNENESTNMIDPASNCTVSLIEGPTCSELDTSSLIHSTDFTLSTDHAIKKGSKRFSKGNPSITKKRILRNIKKGTRRHVEQMSNIVLRSDVKKRISRSRMNADSQVSSRILKDRENTSQKENFPDRILTRQRVQEDKLRSSESNSDSSCHLNLPELARPGGKRFNGRFKYSVFMKDGKRWYPCGICSHSFSSSGDLVRHMRRHTGERPFKCCICSRSYKQKGALNKHLETHEGKKNFICPNCGMRFSQKVHLKSHMRIHTGERPFRCEECGKSFARLDHLKSHENTHSLTRPFKCKLCPLAFKCCANLSKHMRIHLEDRRYRCEYCGASFIVAHSLRMHVRTHTGEKPVHCPLCNMDFRFESSLRKHASAKHPEFEVKGVILVPSAQA